MEQEPENDNDLMERRPLRKCRLKSEQETHDALAEAVQPKQQKMSRALICRNYRERLKLDPEKFAR